MTEVLVAIQAMALVWVLLVLVSVAAAIILLIGGDYEKGNQDRKGNAGIQESEAKKQ